MRTITDAIAEGIQERGKRKEEDKIRREADRQKEVDGGSEVSEEEAAEA
ncbi:MAG: hypothetical protein R3B47_20315 [Bacteroidia bacterium]